MLSCVSKNLTGSVSNQIFCYIPSNCYNLEGNFDFMVTAQFNSIKILAKTYRLEWPHKSSTQHNMYTFSFQNFQITQFQAGPHLCIPKPYMWSVEFLTPCSRLLKNSRICMFYPKICMFFIKTDRFSLTFKVIWHKNVSFWPTIDMVLAKVGYSFAT